MRAGRVVVAALRRESVAASIADRPSRGPGTLKRGSRGRIGRTMGLAALCGLLATAPPAAAASLPPDVVGVEGNHMTLGGLPWLSRGVTLQAFTAPAAFQAANYPQTYNARVNFGAIELAAAKRFGADTLRFQVSQPSLDPQSRLFDPQYVDGVIAGIRLARQSGFVVMIMMQDEDLSGDPTRHPLATAETLRDWYLLTRYFGNDRGVMFELYNEPEPPANAANWMLWAHGDPTGTSTVAPGAVGMQTIIDDLRAQDAENVFVLDGLQSAHTLAGVPPITDPLGRIVYAVHPYFHGRIVEDQWDPDFGDLSRTAPVYADEWSAQAGSKLGLGQLPNYDEAVDFLNYLRLHRISLGAGAFDMVNFMVQAVPGWTPTNYDSYSPAHKQDDAGLLVRKLFLTDYRQPITAQDGVTP